MISSHASASRSHLRSALRGGGNPSHHGTRGKHPHEDGFNRWIRDNIPEEDQRLFHEVRELEKHRQDGQVHIHHHAQIQQEKGAEKEEEKKQEHEEEEDREDEKGETQRAAGGDDDLAKQHALR